MKNILSEIAFVIETSAGKGTTKVACDTAPLAERAFAARAGLGWVGKHTNLIDPQFGSFIFLGEIVTTVAFDSDERLKKNCGGCRRCIDVCPTGALRGDYTIDARRCISDLTQLTDGIPRAMRPFVGTWVWGCDLCQTICPPTQRAGFSQRSDNSAISQDAAGPSLVRLLRLRSSEFRRTFAPTAIAWRGAAVLRRNAAVALGNTLDRSTVPALRDALETDPHPMVRGHAAWALGRIGSPDAIEALENRLAWETSQTARAEIASALEPYASNSALWRMK
jgi:epoxyqueuosine reductase